MDVRHHTATKRGERRGRAAHNDVGCLTSRSDTTRQRWRGECCGRAAHDDVGRPAPAFGTTWRRWEADAVVWQPRTTRRPTPRSTDLYSPTRMRTDQRQGGGMMTREGARRRRAERRGGGPNSTTGQSRRLCPIVSLFSFNALRAELFIYIYIHLVSCP